MSVYLDCNATTPLAPSVVQRITESLTTEWGNPSSNYGPGLLARKAIAEARSHIAEMIGADINDIIFTSGGTEANNMVILGITEYYNSWIKQSIAPTLSDYDKPHVITTNVEHDATILPLRKMEKNGLISLSVIPVGCDGCIQVKDVIAVIQPTTCLITIMYANNETGVIMPLEDLGRELAAVNERRKSDHQIRILYHTDAAQAIGKVQVKVDALVVDYLTVVGHKFYGPRIGCVYARGLGAGETPLYPLVHGGGQEGGYRSGTLNTPMIVGLGEAARLVCDNLPQYKVGMADTRDYLEKKLQAAFPDNITFNCRSPSVLRLPNTSNVSLHAPNLQGRIVLDNCPRLIASCASACHDQKLPSAVLIRSGVPPRLANNAIRLSVGRDTTREDIDVVVDQLLLAVHDIYNKSNGDNIK